MSAQSSAASLKLLLLVPRSFTPRECEEVSSQVKADLDAALGLENVTFMDSASWYRDQLKTSGNWDSWVWETVTGRDYATRERHFDGFVVVGDQLGRATAEIVRLAIQNGRVVLHWKPASPLGCVQTVVGTAEDGVSSWQVGKTTQIGG